MMRYLISWAVLAGCLALPSPSADGQTVFAGLAIGCENDFSLGLSQQSPGDGGIARYSIELRGIEQADAFATVLLRSGEPVAGFTIGGEDLHGDGTLSAAQDVERRDGILWGLGTRGHMPIAVGTFSAGADHIDVVGKTSVDVFARHGSTEIVPAEVELGISIPVCGIADYNGNGLIEQADLDLVLLNWGKPGVPAPDGWVNHLPVGIIDQAELDGVLLNWGNDSGPLARASSVPEPSGIWIAAFCLSMLLFMKRCKH